MVAIQVGCEPSCLGLHAHAQMRWGGGMLGATTTEGQLSIPKEVRSRSSTFMHRPDGDVLPAPERARRR